MQKLVLILCVSLLSISLVQAQDKKEGNQKKEDIHVEVKEGVQPDIYVDGKKFNFPMDLLDKDKIKSINVIKGEKAMKEYNSKNGVILITTKKSSKKVTKLDLKEGTDKIPMVIIDGKKTDRATLNKLSPDDIERINVVKGEQAMKKYKAPNGVIIIFTKKGKKK